MNTTSDRNKLPISPEETERRREALRQADAHNRIEGLFPDPADNAVYEDYIQGKIELDEVWPRLQLHSLG